jgi:hypothetical protein
MANPEHLDLLRQGVDVWNAQRWEEPSISPNLGGADLSEANLTRLPAHRLQLRQARDEGLHGDGAAARWPVEVRHRRSKQPKSAPYELGAIVSQTMIPFQPIIAAGETPFAMLQDLWINHPDRVFRPIHYSSVDALIASLDEKIIRPAEARFVELLARKGETMKGEHV